MSDEARSVEEYVNLFPNDPKVIAWVEAWADLQRCLDR
jgi:hypothetical protein